MIKELEQTSSKLIKNFVLIGECELDVDKIIECWNDKRFSLSSYEESDGNLQYKFLDKKGGKVIISESQTRELIDKLELIEVKHYFFVKARDYYRREFILKEIKRLFKIKKKRDAELSTLNRVLSSYQYSL